MAKTNDEIMDDVAAEMASLQQPPPAGQSILNGIALYRRDMMRCVAMVEAFQAGEDLTLTKLAYSDELAALDWKERVTRTETATAFAEEWAERRKAA